MVDTYAVLIKRNNLGVDIFYYPDFLLTYTCPDNANLSEPFDSTTVLTTHIAQLKEQSKAIPFPQPLETFQKKMNIDATDQWSICYINSDFISGWWEVFLPKFGVFSSITAAITMALIDFLTIKTSVASTAGTGLGIFGAIYSGLMTLIIYYFSNASDFSRQAGRYLDNHLNGLQQLSVISNLAPTHVYYAPLLTKALLTTIPIFTTLFTSYTHFNQVSAIGDKLHKSDLVSKTAFNVVNIIMIIFSIYSKFFFQVSFLPSLYNYIDEKLKCSSASLREGSATLFSRTKYQRLDEDEKKQGNKEEEFTPI